MSLPELNGTIFVSGHKGMVGSAVVRSLIDEGYNDLLLAERSEVDLARQKEVEDFFKSHEIEHVVVAAAKVGGIQANSNYPAEFIYQNLMIQSNIINSAHQSGVQNLIFLGSSCIYPKMAPQPISESSLLTGKLEPTNEPYAISKIAGIKLCESYNRQYGRNYRSLMPTNLYGPNDNFHPIDSHVLPALIRRFHEAAKNGDKEVMVWGSGKPRREFLHVDDLALACVFLMRLEDQDLQEHIDPMQSHVNVGTGSDHSISELARLISEVTGFSGKIVFDSTKPDGTPKKLLDVSLLQDLGWTSSIDLEAGIKSTFDWYKENLENIRE